MTTETLSDAAAGAEYFREHREEVVAAYPNEHVAIDGSGVVLHDPDPSHFRQLVAKRFPNPAHQIFTTDAIELPDTFTPDGFIRGSREAILDMLDNHPPQITTEQAGALRAALENSRRPKDKML